MEALSHFSNGGLTRFWRRRRYRRLNSATPNGKKLKIVRFGWRRRLRKWRVEAFPKLRAGIVTPLKIWTKLKNAYINMMLGLAGNTGCLNNDNVFGGGRIPKARHVARACYGDDEFERRFVCEMYKVLTASRDLANT